MISFDAHTINKGVFKVSFDEEKQAFNGRKKLSPFFHQSIIPALELSLDKYSDPKILIKIQQLKIDLGTIDLEQVGSEWLKQQIYKQVSRQLSNTSNAAINRQTVLEAQIKTYCQFLQYGSLENNSALMTLKEFESLLMADDITLSDIDWPEIIKVLSRQQSRQRFIYQHSAVFFYWFISQIQPFLSLAFKQANDPRLLQLSEQQKKQLLLLCAIKAEIKAPVLLLLPLIQQVLVQQQFFDTARKIDFPNNSLVVENLANEQQLLTEGQANTEQQSSKDDAAQEHDDAFFITAAGVILIHPFLANFFMQLKLLNSDGSFKNQQCQIKAIFLLHYLSNKNSQLEEHQALLFKVMCGFAINKPIPQKMIIDEHEKNESEQLLQAVIKHWQMLKNTSTDGLREAFLQRDGKLQNKHDGWHLLVEQRSIDLLLNQLPWEISIIKFPWMKQAIWVEWA